MNAAAFVQRRLAGTYHVDPWGLDPDVVELVSPLGRLRWSLEVDGAHQLPAVGPAIVVCNRRFGVSEPFVLAAGLARATGRLVRLVGLPDVAPVGPMLRRLGADGRRSRPRWPGCCGTVEMVGVPLALEPTARFRAGWLDPALMSLAARARRARVPGRRRRSRARAAVAARRRSGGGRRRRRPRPRWSTTSAPRSRRSSTAPGPPAGSGEPGASHALHRGQRRRPPSLQRVRAARR